MEKTPQLSPLLAGFKGLFDPSLVSEALPAHPHPLHTFCAAPAFFFRQMSAGSCWKCGIGAGTGGWGDSHGVTHAGGMAMHRASLPKAGVRRALAAASYQFSPGSSFPAYFHHLPLQLLVGGSPSEEVLGGFPEHRHVSLALAVHVLSPGWAGGAWVGSSTATAKATAGPLSCSLPGDAPGRVLLSVPHVPVPRAAEGSPRCSILGLQQEGAVSCGFKDKQAH